ncbi:hypothetical protein [Streptomyces sp. NPDC059398]
MAASISGISLFAGIFPSSCNACHAVEMARVHMSRPKFHST